MTLILLIKNRKFHQSDVIYFCIWFFTTCKLSRWAPENRNGHEVGTKISSEMFSVGSQMIDDFRQIICETFHFVKHVWYGIVPVFSNTWVPVHVLIPVIRILLSVLLGTWLEFQRVHWGNGWECIQQWPRVTGGNCASGESGNFSQNDSRKRSNPTKTSTPETRERMSACTAI